MSSGLTDQWKSPLIAKRVRGSDPIPVTILSPSPAGRIAVCQRQAASDVDFIYQVDGLTSTGAVAPTTSAADYVQFTSPMSVSVRIDPVEWTEFIS
jgi:hypothetical protein